MERTLIEVDLRTMPEHELDDLCAASCKDPFRDMLIIQPGVMQNKQAHFTGGLNWEQMDGGTTFLLTLDSEIPGRAS